MESETVMIKKKNRRKKSCCQQAIVSIIIATYRRDEELKRAIQSALLQDYVDVEIIIVDDNAEPSWNDKVRWIICEFSNLIYIQNKNNCGSAKSRNIGIEKAKGQYVTFLDDDDIYLPEKISKQVSEMELSGADFCITDLYLYNENERLVNKRIRDYIKSADKDELLKYHLMYHMTGTDTMMFRRDYLAHIGGFPPISIGDEFYLMTEAINGGGKFTYLPRCDIRAYVHAFGGLSSGKNKIDGEKTLYDYKRTFFNLLDNKAKQYIKMRHYAVLAYAYIREKNIKLTLFNGIASFLSAPIQCVKLLYLNLRVL